MPEKTEITELFPPQHVEQLHIEKNKFVMVTGADRTHFKSLCQFLSSLILFEPNISVIVFDLGLLKPQKENLLASFSSIEVRTFDYGQYPAYFNITINAGEYAWKPVILHEILEEYKVCVCWMDAGNVITGSLRSLQLITESIGMYSPRSCGVIADWTHPGTIDFLQASDDLLQKHNLNGACVAACYENLEARQLIKRWNDCALTRECIAPGGSNRRNHRQDQAALSVLAHQSGITKYMPTQYCGFKIQQDVLVNN